MSVEFWWCLEVEEEIAKKAVDNNQSKKQTNQKQSYASDLLK